MLAAMSTAPVPPSPEAAAAFRDRGDACPGALRLHAAGDGALARVRVPGGVLSVDQARALGQAALELGDGELHLTSRGNVQLRGLAGGCGGELANRLTATGLLPSARHERIRNIVASPLSGLDADGHTDVRPWLRKLDALLCASDTATGLSGRFLFALDDGRGDVAGLDADVTVRAAPDGNAWMRIGSCGRLARVSADEAPAAALLAAEAFLKASRGQAWRVAELPDRGDGLAAEVVRWTPAASSVVAPWPVGAQPRPGAIAHSGGVSVLAPLGRVSAVQWAELTAAASHELRLTPWRGVVLPATPAKRLTDLAATGLITDPASAWLRVGACIGRPGCAKSRADVRADAVGALGASGSLPVYLSGCERRCGRPLGDHVDAVATGDGGYRITAVRGGREGTARTIDDPSQLAAALAAASTDPTDD
ncbi:cobalamin biosynthesis protein CobG [Streptomyces sp. NPDC014776]|uniref:cobalamin biosynthesis protein CobG n=1 Tax=unclassified Streptomyces TaxID=2593676 RepID=UPI0036FE6D9A